MIAKTDSPNTHLVFFNYVFGSLVIMTALFHFDICVSCIVVFSSPEMNNCFRPGLFFTMTWSRNIISVLGDPGDDTAQISASAFDKEASRLECHFSCEKAETDVLKLSNTFRS